MFQKIAGFFIHNGKLTFILVLVTVLSGLMSYFVLPKQYNPSIVVPAFQVIVQAPGLNAQDTEKLIVAPLENKIMELEQVDEVYGTAGDNFGAVMVKFQVGTEKEKAKIRLTQKLSENLEHMPLGIHRPSIQSIDPDELPQITFAISYYPQDTEKRLSSEEAYIYVRQIANLLKTEVKKIPNVTTLDIVGGFPQNIVVELDLEKIQARNTDIMEIYTILKKNNLSLPSGDIHNNNGIRNFVSVHGRVATKEQIENIIIAQRGETPLYLKDIAKIFSGVQRIDKESHYTQIGEGTREAVFLGVGKSLGSNAVFVTNKIKTSVEQFKNTLPDDIKIDIIQDEGVTAQHATNMLLMNLLQSIIIVFIVLAIYLGVKNAFNTAISIPLTLFFVFLIALIFGENINRITLFALILVLGMLVDNSTVVVENISRHLQERGTTGQSKLDAVLSGVQEVGAGMILATISRLLAFGAMFAVGGMMGEYVGAIPKFAIWTLLISILIALSINPWISYIQAPEVDSHSNTNTPPKDHESAFKLRKKYLKIMKFFINTDEKSRKHRRRFKLLFWFSLFFVILAPIYLGIFQARMLPKSDKDQIYLWIDAPRGWNIQKIQEVEADVIDFFQNTQNLPRELQAVQSISITSGQAFMNDFSNLFRGGAFRISENQISSRINLYSPKEYKKIFGSSRLNSERFVISLRPLLRDYLLGKYPDLQIRLLEDPPGPPVRATFLLKIKGTANPENLEIFRQKIENELKNIQQEYSIEDIGNSESSTYQKIQIHIDHESLSLAKLSTQQVAHTLGIILHSQAISLVNNPYSQEASQIILGVKEDQRDSLSLLEDIHFTNTAGQKIPLSSIAQINYDFVSPEIYSDKREHTHYIYGEMGDNSLVYPSVRLFQIFLSEEFSGETYEQVSWSPYSIHFQGKEDGKQYVIEWGGEWELTMDTFKDLGIAMILSLLTIYFLLVGQFASFRIAGIIMITFLLSFFGVFPGFTLLYLIQNEYFSATSMIGIIALGGIVVGNAIILIEYLTVLKKNGVTIEEAIFKAGYVRFAPIILTSLTTVFGAATIIGDPVWSGLAWAIIWGLLVSSILTLIVIPIFYYDSQKQEWDAFLEKRL